MEGGKPENTEKNPRSKGEKPFIENSSHIWHQVRIKPWPHWWKATQVQLYCLLPMTDIKNNNNNNNNNNNSFRCSRQILITRNEAFVIAGPVCGTTCLKIYKAFVLLGSLNGVLRMYLRYRIPTRQSCKILMIFCVKIKI